MGLVFYVDNFGFSFKLKSKMRLNLIQSVSDNLTDHVKLSLDWINIIFFLKKIIYNINKNNWLKLYYNNIDLF
jgi:hypothetical protein